MTDLVVSILILAAWILASVAWKLRLDQLDRNRKHRQRLRQIKAYTARNPDTVYSNVYSLDTYSRKVNEAA